jgi:hypothetical protein
MTLCRRFSTFILLGVLDREGNMILRNVGNYSPNDTASHTTTPASSATPLCRTASFLMQLQDKRLAASRNSCCILSWQNWQQPFKAQWQTTPPPVWHPNSTPSAHAGRVFTRELSALRSGVASVFLLGSGHRVSRWSVLVVPDVVISKCRGLTTKKEPKPLYLCVLCGSQNKQRLFSYTTLTDWFL